MGSGTDYSDPFVFCSDSYDRYSVTEWNMNIGLLWDAVDRFTIGVVFKTPWKSDVDHEHKFNTLSWRQTAVLQRIRRFRKILSGAERS